MTDGAQTKRDAPKHVLLTPRWLVELRQRGSSVPIPMPNQFATVASEHVGVQDNLAHEESQPDNKEKTRESPFDVPFTRERFEQTCRNTAAASGRTVTEIKAAFGIVDETPESQVDETPAVFYARGRALSSSDSSIDGSRTPPYEPPPPKKASASEAYANAHWPPRGSVGAVWTRSPGATESPCKGQPSCKGHARASGAS